MVALLCGALMGSAERAAGEVIDRVLAVVAGNVITLSDVTASRDFGLVSPRSAADPIREVLSQLIDRALILAEVERYAPPEPAAEAVDRELQQVRARFASSQSFELALARTGLKEEHLRETLRQDLRIRAYLDQRFAVPPPSDDELGRYYRDHQQDFARNGAILSFEEARSEIILAARTNQRRTLVDDWVAGLRRRAEIVDLYRPKT
jgi:parvulin-like peptidyl-prolyl isomerase